MKEPSKELKDKAPLEDPTTRIGRPYGNRNVYYKRKRRLFKPLPHPRLEFGNDRRDNNTTAWVDNPEYEVKIEAGSINQVFSDIAEGMTYAELHLRASYNYTNAMILELKIRANKESRELDELAESPWGMEYLVDMTVLDTENCLYAVRRGTQMG